ncbi:MAG: glycosyl transferase family 90 [Pseudomonadota bacterium]
MRTAAYYGRGLLRQLLPYGFANRQRIRLLEQAARRHDITEIERRANYYNKLSNPFDASTAPRIDEVSRDKSRYFLDLDESSRGFGPDRRLHYLFGDAVTVPGVPTIVKSRPIGPGNTHSVLLKLNKLRHFKWSPDVIPFRDKKPAAVWRGTPLNAQRQSLVRTFYDHPTFDIGHTRQNVDDLPPKAALSHGEQKAFKFFVSLEGNDVATNLKWGMASNMLVMSPQPRFETWFMEGLLEPGKHFVLLRDDLSDLEEMVDYFTAHTTEAEEIIRNAHDWIKHFTDPLKERIIEARVLERYFRLSEQL